MHSSLVDTLETLIRNGADASELSAPLAQLLKAYKKSEQRLDKITKLSDKQQDSIMKQNDAARAEQELAHKKQKAMIVNELELSTNYDFDITYLAADILSGDSYSIHSTKDGGVFIYLVDAMGHGLLPSLTSFALSSFVKQAIEQVSSLEDMLHRLSYLFESLLGDEEQLSFAFFWFDPSFSTLTYSMGGIYPAYLQDANGVQKLTANDIPAMSFLPHKKTTKIELKDFEKFLIYSDGLVEGSILEKYDNDPVHLLDKEVLREVTGAITKRQLEDDLTVLYFAKS